MTNLNDATYSFKSYFSYSLGWYIRKSRMIGFKMSIQYNAVNYYFKIEGM